MRCTNCGWNNPEGVENCQKCNEPLPGSSNQDKAKADEKKCQQVVCLKCGYPVMAGDSYCPNCGTMLTAEVGKKEEYGNKETLRRAADFVPPIELSEQINRKSEALSSIKQTVRDWDNAGNVGNKPDSKNKKTIREIFPNKLKESFSLIPVDSFSGGEEKSFSGQKVFLNRSSLDPQNLSIEEKNHASIEYENDKWYIKDESGKGSTYIAAIRRIEIQEGDIVVIGNRKYIFK